ncbi:hypothetical protein F511_03564 [Dorcoceras hygrometricum]|uniref:Uncharacterized protein n=1 Tax=Dorcoceras hygrometricum TaxID=472368 RepID=A0A2Z7AT86_9LAMI|nr:hypothetical protein F511_03564 [Dorcoceras hygrometricum]
MREAAQRSRKGRRIVARQVSTSIATSGRPARFQRRNIFTRRGGRSCDVRAGQGRKLRQSGPRPDPRLLRQTALEVLTRSARSDSPRKTRPEQNSGEVGRRRRRRTAAAVERGEGGWRLIC